MSALKADLDHLLDQATVKLTGASASGIKAELFDVLHEFFGFTSAWQETISLTVPASITEVSVVPADGGKIIRLDYVVDQNNLPQPAILKGFDTVVLRVPYNVQTSLQAQVVKTVIFPVNSHEIPDMPEWLLQVYPGVILDGVLGKMMGQQTKTYTNLPLSKYHLQRFRDGLATVSTQVMYRNTSGAQAWRYPDTFRQSSQRASVSTIFPRF